MSRRATCTVCGAGFITPSDTGRVPKRCADCAPSTASRNRTEILELRDHVTHLEALLANQARLVRGADRRMLVAAIRRLGLAEGETDTIAALEHIRDVAASWATVLGAEGAMPSEPFEPFEEAA